MYDASHCSKHHVRMSHVAQVSDITHLVGVRLNTWLVKNLQYALSNVELFVVLFLRSWLLRWTGLLVLFLVRVASCRLRSALAFSLDSAMQIRTLQWLSRTVLPVLHRQKTSS